MPLRRNPGSLCPVVALVLVLCGGHSVAAAHDGAERARHPVPAPHAYRLVATVRGDAHAYNERMRIVTTLVLARHKQFGNSTVYRYGATKLAARWEIKGKGLEGVGGDAPPPKGVKPRLCYPKYGCLTWACPLSGVSEATLGVGLTVTVTPGKPTTYSLQAHAVHPAFVRVGPCIRHLEPQVVVAPEDYKYPGAVILPADPLPTSQACTFARSLSERQPQLTPAKYWVPRYILSDPVARWHLTAEGKSSSGCVG